MLNDDDEIVERYKEYRRNAWPQVVARLREIGITEMRIYLLGGRMFMHMEAVDGFDLQRDFPKPGEWWASMEEVFDLSGH
jgi:L-rhamnose mutarotase